MSEKKSIITAISGAAFLMATSAIGPGFITQTTVFTAKQGYSFGFAILASICIDIIIQLSIWRVLIVNQKQAPVLFSSVWKPAGLIITVLIVGGGLVFNIANAGGSGLGLELLLPINTKFGAAISGCIALLIFILPNSSSILDRFVKYLGLLMIAITLYVVWQAKPNALEAVHKSFIPDTFSVVSIVTLVGGTVGGYISFAGAHRLLEAGFKSAEAVPQVTQSAIRGIAVTGVMRFILYLAVAGVVAGGFSIDADNPAASVFKAASGRVGEVIFGVILWSAAITSLLGCTYTSCSFLTAQYPRLIPYTKLLQVVFLLLSLFTFLVLGNPVKLLVAAGAINGMVLPFALVMILLASSKLKANTYKHPRWLTIAGWLVTSIMVGMSLYTLTGWITSFFS
ncbi:MAG: NRAMP family divalent metal transporter [Chryseotalea sp.]|jgi:Mn2+/Fe2+ NRAMP family transporter|nr:divalent metal cation transporter [Flammeovirgaceae bacterium]